ncbi:MAG: hypothetical protein Q4A01_03370 [Coriobacteriales bacterium]|nr:hypothetical protein [Coriobacteriales bacterium]
MADEERDETRMDVNVAERAIDKAFSTGKADRASITRQAREDAGEAMRLVEVAIDSDEEADEAARLAVIASNMGNRERAKKARANEREARSKAKADHRAATKSARQAYEAIKYSDPTKLGFIRLVQFIFFGHIALALLLLVLTSRDTIIYSSANISDWIMVILESVAFYFVMNRYKIARPFVIGVACVGIVLDMITLFTGGIYYLWSMLPNILYYILLILYFVFSRRVRMVFVNDLAHDRDDATNAELVIDRKSWPFYRNLIMYFFVFSVLGHWMEAGFCQLIRLGIVQGDFDATNTMLWRDWFYPYPMHGTAVILIAVILYPLFTWLKKKIPNKIAPYVVSFLINMFVCTLIEFGGGMLFNANLQNWDYSNLPFNFMGQICLQNAIGFGVASSIIAWWLYPTIERLIARVRPSIMNIVCIVVAVAGGILFSLYAIAPPMEYDMGQAGSAEYRREATAEQTQLADDASDAQGEVSQLQSEVQDSYFMPEDDRHAVQEILNGVSSDLAEVQKRIDNAEFVSEEVVKQVDEVTLVSTEFKNKDENKDSSSDKTTDVSETSQDK